MKKLLFCALLTACVAATAQTTNNGGANNGSSSSATTSAQGNNQAVNFSSPSNVTSTLTSTQNVNNSGATTNMVDYRGSYTIKNVPSVNGPNLTTSNDTCMGSTSASANSAGIGLSFGTTWTDEHCKRLKMSRELWNKGMKAASLAMDCMDPAALAALEMTGTKCPQSMTADERVSAYGAQASASGAAPPRPVAAVAPVQPVQPVQPVAAVAPAAPAPMPVAPAPAVAPLPPPPAPQAAAPVQPVAAAQPAPEPAPAAVVEVMPVASATVTAIDPADVAAIRASRMPSEPSGDVTAMRRSTDFPQ